MEDEFIRKLRERYEKGEISKETYEDILQRYMEERGKDVDREKPSEEEVAKNTDITGRDYKCAGSCTLGPGVYGIISSAGSLKITGDIKAEKISSAGSLSSEGNIHADIFRSAGSVKINGDLRGDDISAAGSINVRNIYGDMVKISGMLVCSILQGDTIKIEGGIRAKEMRGDEITVKIDGKGEVERIEGEKINIRSKRGFFRKCSKRLKVGTIKGDTLYLECVIAENVEGNEVTVGENCEIDFLKAERMKVSRNSKVHRVVRK